MSWLANIHATVLTAQQRFRTLLDTHLAGGPIDVERYGRYLTMQYHLTKGVQRYFFAIAAHGSLSRRKGLRAFLVRFANEEELHYLVAGKDLARLDLDVGPQPIDVQMWHAYFEKTVADRPFVRLGAAIVLENLSAGAAREAVRRALSASFLTRDNTRFVTIHQHETLPHGDQLLKAVEQADLDEAEGDDLALGARIGSVLYLRMAEWALDPTSLAVMADEAANDRLGLEKRRIETFSHDELSSD